MHRRQPGIELDADASAPLAHADQTKTQLIAAIRQREGRFSNDSGTNFPPPTCQPIFYISATSARSANWEKIPLKGTTPGRYDIRFTDLKGRSCTVKNLEVKAGALVVLREKELPPECAKK
jgi:hypothetical protein